MKGGGRKQKNEEVQLSQAIPAVPPREVVSAVPVLPPVIRVSILFI